MKLSACVIAKNEADTIGKCLASLQAIVDEIILVDTGSNDDTVAIAKEYQAKVYSYEWKNDFASTKNFALDQTVADWIIFLDADEYFSAETSANVRKIIKKHAHECDGLMIKLINIDADNDNKYIDEFFKVRILKNDKNIRFIGDIHEEVHHLSGRKNRYYQVDAQDILIYHTGYSTSKIQEKCKRNLAILLKQINGTKADEAVFGYLADVYYGLKEYEKAIHYAKLDIAAEQKELSYASRPYRILINSLSRSEDNNVELKNIIMKAIATFPDLPDFYFEYALIKYNDMLYDESLHLLLKAIDLHKNYSNIETSLFKRDLKLAYILIAKIYERKNSLDEAIIIYQQVLSLDKYDVEIFTSLFNILARQKKSYVIKLLNSIYNETKIEDVEFLISHIADIFKGKILLYYIQARKKIMCNSDIDIVELMANNKYDEITEKMRSDLIIKINFLTLSAILLDNKKNLTDDIECLPEEYKNVIWRYYKINDIKLKKNDFEVYKAILLGLRRANKENILMKYCKVAIDFEISDVWEIADLLKSNRCYLEANRLYEYILDKKIIERIDEIYYSIGYCHYRIGQYDQAKFNFEQAMTMGNTSNEIHEFLKWSTIEKLS